MISQKISRTQKCQHPQPSLMIRFGTSYKRGTKVAQYSNLLPERPKLRSLQANPDKKGLLQKANWWISSSGKKTVIRLQQNTKLSMKDVNLEKNHRYSVVVQCFSYHDRARHKSPRRRQRVCKSFSNRPRSRKSIALTNHWNLANLVKIYHGPSYFDTTCIRDEWELLREQYAEYEKGRLLYSCIRVG